MILFFLLWPILENEDESQLVSIRLWQHRNSQNNFTFRTLCLTAGLSEAFTRPGGLPSRGRFEDLLREVANDLKGLSGRMQGPIEVGRCANRETNKCCAGSSWDCQAPGSTCSCDQVYNKVLINSWLICSNTIVKFVFSL